MKIGPTLASITLLSAGALAAMVSGAARAEPPAKAVLLDFSSEALIDGATAKTVLGETIPAKVWRIYPASKWAFVSQVAGGLTSGGVCVVTARVMMVPLTPTLKAVLLRPEKIATAFDALSGASADQCRQLAKAKLVEATQGVVSSLVKS